MECYSYCNDAFFPRLDCQLLPAMRFEYNENYYDKFYLFKRPDPSEYGEDVLAKFN